MIAAIAFRNIILPASCVSKRIDGWLILYVARINWALAYGANASDVFAVAQKVYSDPKMPSVIVESAPMSPWILFTIGGRFRWCAGSRERRITVYGLVFRGGDVASGSISLPHSDAP